VTRERPRPGGLRLRLLAAFVGVAAIAIGAFAALTLWSSRGSVSDLVYRQQRSTMQDAVQVLADAYTTTGSWDGADLRAARVVAVSGDALLEVRDTQGAVVLQAGRGMGAGAGAGRGTGAQHALDSAYGAATEMSIEVGGLRVGRASFRFPVDALPPAEAELRDALTRTTVFGIAAAVVVALLVGIAVVNGITRPLRRLTGAVRRLGAGERGARANLRAPGELGELAAAVDRMAANLEREDELRRALTADVAHELRTPVTILAAQCEALLDGVAEPTPAQISSLHEEVLRLGHLIEDLEALAAAEAAGLRLERAPVDVGVVVGNEATTLLPQFAAAEVTLETRLSGNAIVDGDHERLRQVARNLFANALKFTPAGGRVEAEVVVRDGTVGLTVSDTGPGIPVDELPRVFERFWRGRGAGGKAGSGVGLAVVDELVRAHDGRVFAASPPGRGATFTVELPRAAGPRRPG